MNHSDCNTLLLFPCHPLNKDYEYYKGNIQILQGNKDCVKCEYMNSYGEFINKEYNDYALEICCDVEKNIKKKGSFMIWML